MSSISVNPVGGTPNYTLTVREQNEFSGNRYLGGQLTGPATVSFVPILDGKPHIYKFTVVDAAGCVKDELTSSMNCGCDAKNLTTSATCDGTQPKLLVVWDFESGHNVNIIINNGIGTFNGQPNSGSQSYNAVAGTTYTVTIVDALYPDCFLTTTQTVGSCNTCTLTLTLGTPSC